METEEIQNRCNIYGPDQTKLGSMTDEDPVNLPTIVQRPRCNENVSPCKVREDPQPVTRKLVTIKMQRHRTREEAQGGWNGQWLIKGSNQG